MRVARSRTWKRALVVLAIMGILTAVGVTPAFASDVGRNCKTYYHYGNPALGGFTVCVKLQYDTRYGFLMWRANGSVTTTTPNMVLHSAQTIYQRFQPNEGYSTYYSPFKGPAATQILDITTDWVTCVGGTYHIGWVNEWVTWPDGRSSDLTTTYTKDNNGNVGLMYYASC
jgi:hypothetical protein